MERGFPQALGRVPTQVSRKPVAGQAAGDLFDILKAARLRCMAASCPWRETDDRLSGCA